MCILIIFRLCKMKILIYSHSIKLGKKQFVYKGNYMHIYIGSIYIWLGIIALL